MNDLVWQYLIGFGGISILLGYLGYAHAKSVASLVAGGLCGVAIIVGAIMRGPVGFGICTGVSLLLLLRFLPAWRKRKEFYPAGVMTVLSLVGVAAATFGLIRSLIP